MQEQFFHYTPHQELANVLTHAFGLLLSVVFAPILVWRVAANGTIEQTVGVLLFGLGLLAVYATSTLFHAAREPRLKGFMRILDHMAIFILIGGSYTAFILRFYNEPAGYTFIAIQWALIILGIVLKIFYTGKYEWLSLSLYLFIGLMLFFIYDPVVGRMDNQTFFWLVVGGASYLLGIIFYLSEKLPYHHAIWHVFVLGGSIGHFISLMYAMSV